MSQNGIGQYGAPKSFVRFLLHWRIGSIYSQIVNITQNGTVPVDEQAFNLAIAAEVRGLLARRQITQAQAREHLDMSPNAISRRWSGETPWSTAELLTLCDWLEIDAADVMGAAKRAARDGVGSAMGERKPVRRNIARGRTAKGAKGSGNGTGKTDE